MVVPPLPWTLCSHAWQSSQCRTFCNIQSEPSPAQFEVISSCHVASYLWEETDPTNPFQAVVERDEVSLQLQAKQKHDTTKTWIRNNCPLALQGVHLSFCKLEIWVYHPVKATFAHVVLASVLARLIEQLQEFSTVISQRVAGLFQVQRLEAGRHLKLPLSPLATAEYIQLCWTAKVNGDTNLWPDAKLMVLITSPCPSGCGTETSGFY